jgi:prevent-host-death family protein
MDTVGSYEAKTHLASLLERVAQGDSITITRHGQPIARLVPVEPAKRRDAKTVIEELKQLRKGRRVRGVSIRALIEEGRRF